MGHESNIEVAEQSHPVGIESMEIPLDPELVRGVPLRFCLHGLGKYWSMTRKADFDLSEKTDHIDHFLSHDWGTSRSLKVMTLLIVFNSCAAAVATSLVVLLLSITASTGLIPPKLWPWLPLPGFLCYVSILLFWQDVRLLCRRPLLAFLDKLCIAQHDLHLKEQGIRGLGSFLRCSRNLNILWSERYFSRLWCCYEVAAYLKEGGFRDGEKSIVLIPVQMASLLLISTIQSCSTFLVQYVSWLFQAKWMQNRFFLELIGKGTIFVPLALYVALSAMVSLFELPRQLQDFRVQETECFCCSQHHRSPSGVLPCDRELVFSLLEKWFGGTSGAPGEYLEHFNLLVRDKLSDAISHTIGRGLPQLQYVLFTVCAAPLPFYPLMIALESMEGGLLEGGPGREDDDEDDDEDEDDEEGFQQRPFAQFTETAMDLLVPPLYGAVSLLLMVQSCRLVDAFCPLQLTPLRRALLSVFLSPVIWGALSYGLWEPLVADLLEGIEGEQILKLMIYFTYWAITLAFFCLPTFEIFEQKASGDRDRSRRTEGREVNVLGCKEVQELPLEEDYVSEYF
ncbi:Uncharacterized protein SCF082_LOCUS36839 [Durusdinium trenchii]|uniref:Uncharacterized protein n=1 Tax=Durusdinium trenchii TaxID=1381693 RepID=A0ABP0PK59_9DINO